MANAAEALASSTDIGALAKIATVLESLGRTAEAVRAFAVLSASAREDGQLALGLYAAKAVARLGDQAQARALEGILAETYAAGSTRIDPTMRPRPKGGPTGPTGRGKGKSAPQAAPAHEADEQVVCAQAVKAVEAAWTRAEELAKSGRKLPAVPLAGSLDVASLRDLISLMRSALKPSGTVVVEVGDDADALWWVARGALRVTRGDHLFGHLRAGAFFGEIALLGGTRRTARVTCAEDCWLLEIPRDAVEEAARKAPRMADTLAAYARARLLSNTMRTTEIFSRLEPEERAELVVRFETCVFAPGTVILEEGREGDRLHVIVSGDVEVRRDSEVRANLGAGDVFGEMSLVGRKPATAHVVAVTRTVTLALDRSRFDPIAVKHPELLAEVYRIIVAREAENRAAPVPQDVDEIVV